MSSFDDDLRKQGHGFEASATARELQKREERNRALLCAAQQTQLGRSLNPGVLNGISDPYYTLLGAYGAAQNAQVTPKPVIFGKLLWRGEPLPEGWQGALYTRKTRTMDGRNWCVLFSSPWSNENIEANFDSEQYSGQEVDRMAETFMEVINQRRLG